MKRVARGQSEVIGTVLLLGITIAAVTVTVAAGGAALGFVTDDARSASVENGLSQLSSQSSLVALGDTDARRFDLGSIDGGQLTLDETAGSVEIRIENGSETDIVYSDSLGTLSYAGDDRTVAMQGGGVWTKRGDHSRMVSPPEYHYRGTTLTFPIVRLTGDDRSPSAGAGVVRRGNSTQNTIDLPPNPLQDGTVVIEVTSEYYDGWYDFFTQRADGAVTKDDTNQTVTARLVVPEDVSFDRAISVGDGGYTHSTGNENNGPGNNNGLDESAYYDGSTHPPVEPMIESTLASAEESEATVDECFTGSDPCDAGTYYAAESVTVPEDVDFNTSEGNITLAIDGDLDLNGKELTNVDSGSGTVTYYVNGSVFASGGTVVGTENPAPEATRTQLYVGEDFLPDAQGDITIEAVVYAPNSETNLNGAVTLRGAFAVQQLTTGSNAFTVEYDSSLFGSTITIAGGEGQSPITYLHVSENVVELDFDR